MTGAKKLSMNKDEVIIEEGVKNKNLYRIISGITRIEKKK